MLKKYVWVVEWITTALLIVLGIIAVVEKTILLYTFGILFIIFGLFTDDNVAVIIALIVVLKLI